MDENEVFTPVHVRKRIYTKTAMSVNKGEGESNDSGSRNYTVKEWYALHETQRLSHAELHKQTSRSAFNNGNFSRHRGKHLYFLLTGNV